MGMMDDVIATDAEFLNDGDLVFGTEEITLTLSNGAQTFNAQVFRNPPEQVDDVPTQMTPAIEVFIHSARITAALRVGVDTVGVPTTLGTTTPKTTHVISRIISQDAGGYMLALSH